MRERWKTQVRGVPQVASFEYVSPSDGLSHHDLFDLATRVLVGATRNGDPELRRIVAHGLAALGFGHLTAARVWRDDEAPRDALASSLCAAANDYDQKLLQRLWAHRGNLARVMLYWDNLIEGHPVLAMLDPRSEREEFATIADGVLSTAQQARRTMNDIDDFVLKVWGVAMPTPPPTLRDLARTCPDVITLNSLYSQEDFDESPQ